MKPAVDSRTMPDTKRTPWKPRPVVLRGGCAFVIAMACVCGQHAAKASPPPVETAAASPSAKPNAHKAPVGFSKLLIRLEGDDEIGIAKGEFRISILERMRRKGLSAVGGENLVFDRDESSKAAFMLGGTVKQVECKRSFDTAACRIAIEWQLLDVETDRVVYTALTRAKAARVQYNDPRVPKALVEASLDSLLSRARFLKLLEEDPTPRNTTDPGFSSATYAKCEAPSAKMPEAAEQLLQTAVVVKGRSSFGSGFFVSPDGLVLTAAHVLDQSKVTLRMRDGTELEAVPIRVARNRDAALLRPVRTTTGQRCLDVNLSEPSVGGELYAIGTPADMQLAFSLTRGVVSGVRLLDGQRIIQTDAPISPGNSGGPLLDAQGKVLGIARSKVSGRRVEGIAFGVPISDALKSLGLSPGKATDASLLSAPAVAPTPTAEAPAIVDTPDELESLDSQPSSSSSGSNQQWGYVPPPPPVGRTQRIVGWIGFATGATIASYAYFGYYTKKSSDEITHDDYKMLRTANAVGWGMAAVGLGLVVFAPSKPKVAGAEKGTTQTAPKAALSVGPGSVHVMGSF